MIIFLQYTLADLRVFTEHDDALLRKPHWPSPKPFAEFVRGAGAIIERRKQGLSSWVGENFICNVRKGITFPSKIQLSNSEYIRNISKHMYANEHYVLTKYEFVFNLKLNKGLITYDIIKDVVDSLFSSTVIISTDTGPKTIPLGQLSKSLKDFHYRNTTQSAAKKKFDSSNLISYCSPQLYIYLDKNEHTSKLESNFKLISNTPGFINLYGAWYNHRNNPIRLWVHERDTSSSLLEESRALRMTIMRVHSEYECLKNIFNAIADRILNVKERSAKSNLLQGYFNHAIRTFLIEESNLTFKSRNKNFLDYFSKVFAKAQPGELERLYDRIKEFNFRGNIERKTVTFIADKMEFMGNKYENNNSTILSQGDNNTIENNSVQQNINSFPKDFNYSKLLEELIRVRKHAENEAANTEQRKDIVALSEAEDAAKSKDGNGVVKALKTGSKWIGDVASKLTANILVELLKQHTKLI